MKSKKLFTTVLGLPFVLAMTLPVVAQSAPQSNTTTTTTTTSTPDSTVAPASATILQDSSAPDTNAPMTKGKMKDQKKQQKQEEKSADANAKAQKGPSSRNTNLTNGVTTSAAAFARHQHGHSAPRAIVKCRPTNAFASDCESKESANNEQTRPDCCFL